MTNNVMTALKCETPVHGEMKRLIAQPTPPLGSAAFTLWICDQCGKMALHLEVPGDIYWYTSHRHSQVATHQAGCAYCTAKFACACGMPGARHMCPECDDAAEESKRTGGDYVGGGPLAPRERADSTRTIRHAGGAQ